MIDCAGYLCLHSFFRHRCNGRSHNGKTQERSMTDLRALRADLGAPGSLCAWRLMIVRT